MHVFLPYRLTTASSTPSMSNESSADTVAVLELCSLISTLCASLDAIIGQNSSSSTSENCRQWLLLLPHLVSSLYRRRDRDAERRGVGVGSPR